MPNPDSPDDVATLLDRSGIGIAAAGYKSFAGGGGVRPKPKPARALEAIVAEPKPPATPSAQPESDRADAPSPVMRAAARLLSAAEGGQRSLPVVPAGWESLPWGRCLALTGVTGGVGATTILANAAAALAACSERVAAADEAPSLLPFYFGGENFRSGSASFAPQRGSTSGPVHLVTGSPGRDADWLLKGLTEFRDDADRFLIRCSAGLSQEELRWTCRAAAVVVLLTPDPGPLLRLPAVLDRIRQNSDEQAHPPLLLLNQFETSNPLHIEIRSELSRRFGEHLLPFVIERDPAFSRCLAEGAAAVEIAPGSPGAQGVGTLVEWLRNYRFDPES